MTKMQKIGIGVGIGICIFGLILVLFFRSNSNNQNVTPNPVNTAVQNTNTQNIPTPPPKETPTPNTNTVDVATQDDQAKVLRLARIIIERYGSFSNRNNFENIRSLEAFMTEDFRKRSFDYIDKNENTTATEDFYGVSTAAASLEMTDYQEGASATVRVETRRVETRANEETKQLNQAAVMEFIQVGANWKVNNITWE